jgi:hypothetical protein
MLSRRSLSACTAILPSVLGALSFACGATSADEPTALGKSSAALTSAPDDSRVTDANVIVSLANPASPEPRCAGILLTPTAVLTARGCVAPERAGRRPVVLVGTSLQDARGYLASKDAVVLGGAGASSGVDGAGELAIVFLDPYDFVDTNVQVSRPKLAAPFGVALPGEPNARLGAYRLAVAGFADAPVSGVCSTPGARQIFDVAISSLATFTPAGAGAQPFWVRSAASDGALSRNDLGSPLVLEGEDGVRQVIGIASGAAHAATDGACTAAGAGACDVFTKITSNPARKFIVDTLRRATVVAASSWTGTHPPVNVGPDGVKDWWHGEVEYQGSCREDEDFDCDHWLDEHDNCVGVYNPDQTDSDGDNTGDACECPATGDCPQHEVLATGKRVRALAANVTARAGAVAATPAGKALAQDLWQRVDDALRLVAALSAEQASSGSLGAAGDAELTALKSVVDDLRAKRQTFVAAAGLGPDGLDTQPAASVCAAPTAGPSERSEGRLRYAAGGFSGREGFGRDSLRYVGDVNGDGKTDLVAITSLGTEVALSDGRRFLHQGYWSKDIRLPGDNDDPNTFQVSIHGEGRTAHYQTALADVTGDGRADLLNVGDGGVFMAESTGSGFLPMRKVFTFPPNSIYVRTPDYDRNWRLQVSYLFGDVTGDGRADLVTLNSEDVQKQGAPDGESEVRGSVAVLQYNPVTGSFGAISAWARSPFALIHPDHEEDWDLDSYPRVLADVNGDGRNDLVGFGQRSVWVGLNTGNAFQPAVAWSQDFTNDRGYFSRYGFRFAVDVNGDKVADLVGGDRRGTFFATGTKTSFEGPELWAHAYEDGTNWNEMWYQPRYAGDVDGDGKADVIGMGIDGVYVLRAVDGAVR